MIERLRSMIAGIREGIASGTRDMDSVDAGLSRIESLLGGMQQQERTDPDKRPAADFFRNKKRKEGDWKNPLSNR